MPWRHAMLHPTAPQFPFDLHRPARVGAVKAFATYDYVILNSEFTDRSAGTAWHHRMGTAWHHLMGWRVLCVLVDAAGKGCRTWGRHARHFARPHSYHLSSRALTPPPTHPVLLHACTAGGTTRRRRATSRPRCACTAPHPWSPCCTRLWSRSQPPRMNWKQTRHCLRLRARRAAIRWWARWARGSPRRTAACRPPSAGRPTARRPGRPARWGQQGQRAVLGRGARQTRRTQRVQQGGSSRAQHAQLGQGARTS